MNRHALRRLRPIACLALAAALLAGALPAPAQEPEWREGFPKIPSDAARLYDIDMPPDDWLDGPVQYIILDLERDIWRDLETDEERRDFIAWFWARRDVDSRDEEHPFRLDFYSRVAFANERFHGFPRGWRGDRGHVIITLGRPTGGMRRVNLAGYGRCSAESGEQWTYYTQNMAFNSSMGEFSIIFMESRIGQYEICDPYMLGPGGWPDNVRRAFMFTNEAVVFDTVTEFGSDDAARPVDAVRTAVASTEPLSVPEARWGMSGAGSMVVVPMQIPLRDLLFEPGDNTLVATLIVDASLVGLGDQAGEQGQQQWKIELDAEASRGIGGSSVRTALALPAAPGGYSVSVRVVDPLSAKAWVWDGSVEIADEGSAVSSPLVGSTLVRLREGGEVALITPELPSVSRGGPVFAVAWVRGRTPDPRAVTVALAGVDGVVHELDGQAFWGSAAAGPLVYQATVPDLAAGMYTLTLVVAPDLEPVLARLRIE